MEGDTLSSRGLRFMDEPLVEGGALALTLYIFTVCIGFPSWTKVRKVYPSSIFEKIEVSSKFCEIENEVENGPFRDIILHSANFRSISKSNY